MCELRGERPTRVIAVKLETRLNHSPYRCIEASCRDPEWLAQADWSKVSKE